MELDIRKLNEMCINECPNAMKIKCPTHRSIKTMCIFGKFHRILANYHSTNWTCVNHLFSIFEFNSGLVFFLLAFSCMSLFFFVVLVFIRCRLLIFFFFLSSSSSLSCCVLCFLYTHDRKKSHVQSEKLCAALVCTSHSDCNSLVSNRKIKIQ